MSWRNEYRAYFGVNEVAPRDARDRPDQRVEVAAVSLLDGGGATTGGGRGGGTNATRSRLLWRRRVHSRGMLNNIHIPALASARGALADRVDALCCPRGGG